VTEIVIHPLNWELNPHGSLFGFWGP
jgi:hypothetical protein